MACSGVGLKKKEEKSEKVVERRTPLGGKGKKNKGIISNEGPLTAGPLHSLRAHVLR